jgi:hypothetical protein
MTSHPRVQARGTRTDSPPGVIAIIYSPLPERMQWIEAELASGGAVIQIGHNVNHLVAALVEDPAPRPQLLVVDVDNVSAGELLELHAIREQGWTGTIIAIGKVPVALRKSLGIDVTLGLPLADGCLTQAVARQKHTFNAPTTQIPLPQAEPERDLARYLAEPRPARTTTWRRGR